ncbi:MAG: hypothetical protein LBU65_00440, partial [Planctomycetaceae bacterium]|nr:hypothetical protein [Planctomycetaceae bacterium]
RGFKYFAFDLVMVKKDENTKEAIAYHFESNFVYYPMVISGVGGTGKTKVELVVFSKGGLTKNNGLNVINEDENKHPYTGYVYGRNKESGEGGTVEITNAELNGLDPAFGKLFDGGGAKGRIFIIEGELDKFDKDVVLSD